MLDGGLLASHSSQHVGRCSLGCPFIEDLIVDVSVGQVPKVGNICIYPFGSSAVCATQTGVLFLSLSGGDGGKSNVYVKGLPAVLEGMGWLVCSTGLPNNAISAPNYQIFCYICFRLAWPGIPLVYIILLFLLFGASLASQGF